MSSQCTDKPDVIVISQLLMDRISNLTGSCCPAPKIEIVVPAEAWHSLQEQLVTYFGAELTQRATFGDTFWYGSIAFRRDTP